MTSFNLENVYFGVMKITLLFVVTLFCTIVSSQEMKEDSIIKKGKWLYYGKENPITKVSISNKSDSTIFDASSFIGINQFDSLGRKQGHWILYGIDRTDSGYADSVKTEEGIYENNAKNGIWVKYLSDGKTIKLAAFFKNGRPTGTYCRGCKINTYNRENKIEFQKDSLGKENGWVSFFYPNESLEFTYFSKSGIPEGNAYVYCEHGEVISKRVFIDGICQEIYKTECSHKNGRQSIINQIDKEGKKQGHWIYYGKDRPDTGFADSSKYEEGDFFNDRKEGVWIRYHSNGNPKIKGEFENGRPNYNYSKFYENGSLKTIQFRNDLAKTDTIFYFDSLGRMTERIINVQDKTNSHIVYSFSSTKTKIDTLINNSSTKFKEFTSCCTFGRKKAVLSSCVLRDPNYIPTYVNNSALIFNYTTFDGKFNPYGINAILDKGYLVQTGLFKNGRLWDGQKYLRNTDSNEVFAVLFFKNGELVESRNITK